MLSSNWLDRLRASKGLSSPSDLDLEHFLSSLPDPNPRAPSSPNHHSPTNPAGDDPQILNLMPAILAEVFIMAGPLPERPKASRKQRIPKLCRRADSVSANGGIDATRAPARSPSSADTSAAAAAGARKGRPAKLRRKRGPASSDFGAYSRTEVTVIDTSAASPGWKSEKIIFRRGLVWKVKDKKSWNFSRKKRKLGAVDRLGGEKGKEKLQQGVDEAKTSGQKESLASLDQEAAHAHDQSAAKDMRDTIPVPKKRLKFLRSPRVPAAKDSSIYRIKVLTKSRRSGTSCRNHTPKGK